MSRWPYARTPDAFEERFGATVGLFLARLVNRIALARLASSAVVWLPSPRASRARGSRHRATGWRAIRTLVGLGFLDARPGEIGVRLDVIEQQFPGLLTEIYRIAPPPLPSYLAKEPQEPMDSGASSRCYIASQNATVSVASCNADPGSPPGGKDAS